MCKYCYERDGRIRGKMINTWEWRETAGYRPKENKNCYRDCINSSAFEKLEMFILKGRNEEKAGLMINTISGARYIDIDYCPMCGRKLS